MPGTLPVLNTSAVRMAIQAGIALNCTINRYSVFSRKNYFYPDLPKGYQISQFDAPICGSGYLDIIVQGKNKRIRITRIHMEEDAGKLVHQGANAISGSTGSLVDLNRAGIPLIEIVSEPDIRSAEEARIYVETIRQILVFTGLCDGNLEKGNLRADANISMRPVRTAKLGIRTEIKNVNSFRIIERAILSEIRRQTEILTSGGTVLQQTRLYNDNTRKTQVLRGKEDAHDYRYFPDPDLKPLIISDAEIDELRTEIPELPVHLHKRYETVLGISRNDVNILMEDPKKVKWFEQCLEMAKCRKFDIPATVIAKWLVRDVNALVKVSGRDFTNPGIHPETFLKLLGLVISGKISNRIAKEILPEIFRTGISPESLLAKYEGGQMSDTTELETLIQSLILENPDIVKKIVSGKISGVNFLIGQIMRATRGRANPDKVNQIVMNLIG
jgi:aspartyl-tRNA(Asn)/glutamyl-tRNA(Gln) amidotransferase subunit B